MYAHVSPVSMHDDVTADHCTAAAMCTRGRSGSRTTGSMHSHTLTSHSSEATPSIDWPITSSNACVFRSLCNLLCMVHGRAHVVVELIEGLVNVSLIIISRNNSTVLRHCKCVCLGFEFNPARIRGNRDDTRYMQTQSFLPLVRRLYLFKNASCLHKCLVDKHSDTLTREK